MRHIVQLTLATVVRPRCTRKWMQVVAGRWVRHQQIDSSCAAVFTEYWGQLAHWPSSQPLPEIIITELIMCLGLLPRMCIDLRLPCSPCVTVSDASLTGGAVCASVGVTPAGAETVQQWLGGSISRADDEVALLACFDGIGGARRAMELAGVNVAAYLSCEVDEPAKRVVRYSWPTRHEMGSITKLTGQAVAEVLELFPRVLLLLVCSGFPCKGLSSSNIQGDGLQNKQSVLLFELIRLLGELRSVLNIKVRFLAECVASMGEQERMECSRLLGCAPVIIDGACISHCRRERLYWSDWFAEVAWQAPRSLRRGVLELRPPGGPGVTARWKRPGVRWPRSSGLDRFATFLRARPQKKEPPLMFANGRDRVDKAGLKLWAKELWRY